MPVARTSLSMTQELARAIDQLANERGEDRSRLIETLLRENPLVQRAVQRARGGPLQLFGRPRDPDELRALARVGRRQWSDRVASGRVRIRGRDP